MFTVQKYRSQWREFSSGDIDTFHCLEFNFCLSERFWNGNCLEFNVCLFERFWNGSLL